MRICVHSDWEGQIAHASVIWGAWVSLPTVWQLVSDSFRRQRGKYLKRLPCMQFTWTIHFMRIESDTFNSIDSPLTIYCSWPSANPHFMIHHKRDDRIRPKYDRWVNGFKCVDGNPLSAIVANGCWVSSDDNDVFLFPQIFDLFLKKTRYFITSCVSWMSTLKIDLWVYAFEHIRATYFTRI